MHLEGALNDFLKLRLKCSSTDKKTVDVVKGNELLAIVTLDRATVDNADIICDIGRHVASDPSTQISVGFLSLSRSRYDTRANCPYGLIGNDNVRPVFLRYNISESLHLMNEHVQGLIRLSVFKRLTNTK